jgi:hypothetical protein
MEKHGIEKEEVEVPRKKKKGEEKKAKRIYLNVPFNRKNVAKKMGAKFCCEEKKWFVLSGSRFAKDLIKVFDTL